MEGARESAVSTNEVASLLHHISQDADPVRDVQRLEKVRAALVSNLNSYFSLADLRAAQDTIAWNELNATLAGLAREAFDTRALQILGNALLTFRDDADFRDIFNAVKGYRFFEPANTERAREELRKRTEGFTV